MTTLRVQQLTKVYGTRTGNVSATALNGMNLKIQDGEFVSIMGPSGSGKTTLLNILAGLDKATSGRYILRDKDVSDLGADELAEFRRRELGFVFQDFNLLDTLTLAENVALPLSLSGMRGKALQQRVKRLMQQLGIGELMNRYPYEVSGGQQQRTAVARAMIHDPALVLADEPTGNLDSASAQALLKLFQSIHEELGATVLMVTHDPLSASYSSRVVLIQDGRVYSELERSGDRRAFFQEILSSLSVLEGAKS